MDPRKTVFTPEEDRQSEIYSFAHSVLLAATEEGAKAIGCTGASFVLMGIGIWASELCELDAQATAQFYRAIGDLYDPASDETKKKHAEKRRITAVRKLFAALDLEMANAAGST